MDHVQARRDIDGGGTQFKTFSVTELHPTFGAEIQGVEFPDPSEEQFEELLRAIAKVTALRLFPIYPNKSVSNFECHQIYPRLELYYDNSATVHTLFER
ncbi:hypothetical protein J1614_008260 [Plenodomus biglobosus]|nr:hypothetical protein J1614_008260 [Plenodomus biglobosus]